MSHGRTARRLRALHGQLSFPPLSLPASAAASRRAALTGPARRGVALSAAAAPVYTVVLTGGPCGEHPVPVPHSQPIPAALVLIPANRRLACV